MPTQRIQHPIQMTAPSLVNGVVANQRPSSLFASNALRTVGHMTTDKVTFSGNSGGTISEIKCPNIDKIEGIKNILKKRQAKSLLDNLTVALEAGNVAKFNEAKTALYDILKATNALGLNANYHQTSKGWSPESKMLLVLPQYDSLANIGGAQKIALATHGGTGHDMSIVNLDGIDFSHIAWRTDDRAIMADSSYEVLDRSHAAKNRKDEFGNSYFFDYPRISLQNVSMKGANLIGADLRGADLMNANLYGAVLKDTDLSNTIISNTDFRKAIFLNTNFAACRILGGDPLFSKTYDELTQHIVLYKDSKGNASLASVTAKETLNPNTNDVEVKVSSILNQANISGPDAQIIRASKPQKTTVYFPPKSDLYREYDEHINSKDPDTLGEIVNKRQCWQDQNRNSNGDLPALDEQTQALKKRYEEIRPKLIF